MNSAIGIGLLPQAFSGRITSIGNAAGAGAGMLLQNQAICEEAKRIISIAETVELSSDPYFSKTYVRSMSLT